MHLLSSGSRMLAAAVSTLLFATGASAATTITGSVTGINARTSDPGLVISASALAFPTFTLNNVGDFADFNVLRIGTEEGSVNLGEDTTAYPISVTFSFSSPNGTNGGPISGTTEGFIAPLTSCGVLAGGCGRVQWGAPSIFSFAGGGQFSVRLVDTVFGTPGDSDVRARFTLLRSAVPEPGTWAMMLLGFGAIGYAMRRQRRETAIPQAA